MYLPKERKGLIDTSNIKPEVTTKEELFLEFGNAFQQKIGEERLFTAGYVKKADFFWVFAATTPYGGGGIGTFGDKSIVENYVVEVEFDDNDIVKRCETFKLPK